MSRIAFIACMLILFAGCGDKKPQVSVAPKPLPQWYTHPPASNATTLFGTGEGVDRQSAVNDALSLIASNLSVTIASQYESEATETRRNGKADSDITVRNAIQAEVKAIRINNYRIVHSVLQGFRRHLALVKVEKADLFAGIKQELDQKISGLKSTETLLQNQHALDRYRHYKRSMNLLAETENTLLVLKVLNPAFDAADYRRSAAHFEQAYLRLKNEITVSVYGTSSAAKGLIAPVQEGFGRENITVSNRKGPDHFIAEIDASVEKAEEMGFFLARTAVVIRIKDSSGQTLSSRTHNMVGQSSQSHAIALNNVAVKLGKLIRKEGIFSAAGMDI